MLHSNSPLVGQISGGLAYSVRNLEGRFLRFQVSCPGEDVGCLPFKIQGRAADVPGNDSMTCTSRPVFFSRGMWLIAHVHSVCVCILSTSLLCLDCHDDWNFFCVSPCR